MSNAAIHAKPAQPQRTAPAPSLRKRRAPTRAPDTYASQIARNHAAFCNDFDFFRSGLLLALASSHSESDRQASQVCPLQRGVHGHPIKTSNCGGLNTDRQRRENNAGDLSGG